LKPGTSYGPFCDFTDTLKSYGLSAPDQSNNQSRLKTLTNILSLILNNEIPTCISTLLAFCRFLALHKDPDDLDKLRPIGIGTVWRRLAGSVIALQFADTFAEFLLPAGQLGLTIRGGLDFLTHTANCQHDAFITQPLSTNLPPQRAGIFVDLVNCWNQMSREEALDVLESEPRFHSLVHYFDLMYENPNRCFFHRPDGSLDFFIQEDGFPQGDPLSPALACLVINRILGPINAMLEKRAQARRTTHQRGDDGCGSKSAAHAYFDDAFAFLPYDDLPIFIETFQRLGPPIGIILNKTKTKILTLPTTHATITTLTTPQYTSLQQALSLLNGPTSEITGGFRLLGQPLGSQAFCTAFLDSAALKFASATKRLTKRITDPQSIATLFKFCTLPSISHLLAADVLHHSDTTSPPIIHSWSSPLTDALTVTNIILLKHISNTNAPLSPLALLLAHLPLTDGGIGLRDHSQAALPAFLVPLIRSIRYATQGIPYRHSNKLHKLAPIFAKTLSTWNTARHPTKLIRVFRHYLPLLTSTYNTQLFKSTQQLSPCDLVLDAPTKGLQSRLYHHFTAETFLTFRSSLDASDPTTDILPSLLSPTTGIPLHSLPRRFQDHRFTPDKYRLLLRRKLRLPLFDTPTPRLIGLAGDYWDKNGELAGRKTRGVSTIIT
jgi:hypothetical protein